MSRPVKLPDRVPKRLRNIRANMVQRCHNPQNDNFKHYGQRGISVCREWRNRTCSFYDWALGNGYAADLEIDRIDTNGNYEPGNCRWISHAEQTRNTRSNILVTYDGRTQILSEWAKEIGLNYYTLLHRVRAGKSPSQILDKKVAPTYASTHAARSKQCG